MYASSSCEDPSTLPYSDDLRGKKERWELDCNISHATTVHVNCDKNINLQSRRRGSINIVLVNSSEANHGGP